jgi:8-oxo-dGTP pyrophosphatase MutT (NUDIX family)
VSRVTRDLLERLFRLEGFAGPEAQRRMEPTSRGPRPPRADVETPRDAAALAYLFPREGRFLLPLTLRRPDLPEHRGQVSLPGGRPEAGEALWRTALREAEEEVGLHPALPEPLGVLAPVYIPITHTRLHVHLALGPDPGPLVANPREVERIVEVHLDELLDPARRRIRPLEIAGRLVDVPYFDVAGLFLWGATAMALSELVERVRRLLDGAGDRA